jgi:pyruvate dehydrogenase E1 component alpha subunit/2-oxoisovalerate dehydrogenase E1 component alpha subunit
MISVVNGILLAHRFKGIDGRVGAACMGDGASSTGSFHEALNQAAVERLPLVLVIANNQYAYSTPNDRQFACESLADKAPGYGVPALSVDGTDLAACLRVVGKTVEHARQGAGPQLVVANLLRLCGHGEHDDASYVDPALRTTQTGRDCMKVAESQIVAEGIATEAQLDQWRAAAVALVEQTVARVQREPAPDAREEDWRALSTRHLCEGQLP